MNDPHSPMTDDLNGKASYSNIDDRPEAVEHVQADGLSPLPVRFPLPLPHSGDPETVESPISDRESNQTPAQSPATRSSTSQHTEKPRKTANRQADSHVWVTEVGHNCASDDDLTLSNRSENRPQQWVTRLGHKRSVRGLSLRGSIHQFRVRVPVDVRDGIGRSHVKRSLGTDSLSLFS